MRSLVAWLRAPDVLAGAVLLAVAVALTTDPQPVRASAQAIEAKVRSVRELENRRARAGVVPPAWDPYQFGGRPYMAAFDSQIAYPPAVLLQVVPVQWSFSISLALHAWIAGLGAYLVVRRLDVSTWPALAGGVGVMLATVAAPGTDLSHSVDAHRLAWVPLCLALAMRSASRSRRWPDAGLVLALAVVLLASSWRLAVYAGGSAAAWYLFAMFRPDAPATRRTLAAQLAAAAVLALSLTAFHTLPAVRLWLSADRAGGLSVHDWNLEESSSSVTQKATLDEEGAPAFEQLRGHRTLSACTRVVDEADLLALRVPSIGGFGGVFLGDYARFVNIASGLYPEKPAVYAGIDGAGGAPARADLLRFLDVEYLIACERPDPERWTHVLQTLGVGVYRNRSVLGRAVWTCEPKAIGRGEIEYRLRRYRYDDTLTLRGGGALIHVRWAPQVDDDARARAETHLRILPERFLGDRTWQYELFDGSPAAVQAIVTSPLVEDTAGLDRGTFAVVSRAPDFQLEPQTEWLVGFSPCPDTKPASVLSADQSDGHLAAEVDAPRDGIVLFSEPYYPLRAALVDGARVESRKVNLAFTGVPVTAGRHRVELRYDPRGFQAGSWLSLAAVLIWAGGEWRARR